jgi:hypothetical protein
MVAHVRGALGEEFKIIKRCVLDGGDNPRLASRGGRKLFGES